jgi:hypothetical protein
MTLNSNNQKSSKKKKNFLVHQNTNIEKGHFQNFWLNQELYCILIVG